MSILCHKILRGISYNALGLLASIILNFVAIRGVWFGQAEAAGQRFSIY